jgi:hypothetical protein
MPLGPSLPGHLAAATRGVGGGGRKTRQMPADPADARTITDLEAGRPSSGPAAMASNSPAGAGIPAGGCPETATSSHRPRPPRHPGPARHPRPPGATHPPGSSPPADPEDADAAQERSSPFRGAFHSTMGHAKLTRWRGPPSSTAWAGPPASAAAGDPPRSRAAGGPPASRATAGAWSATVRASRRCQRGPRDGTAREQERPQRYDDSSAQYKLLGCGRRPSWRRLCRCLAIPVTSWADSNANAQPRGSVAVA